jgi:hypothetical protein
MYEYSKKMINTLHKNFWLIQNISDDILPVDLYRLFVEYAIMQQHHQQITVVSTHGLLFGPSSGRELFKIKEKIIQSS